MQNNINDDDDDKEEEEEDAPPGRCRWDHQPGIITWQVHHHHHHHLAGAGEEESFLNRWSPLLLQSGEVVQAVAVSHLQIWIDCDILTLVGIF